MVTFAPRARAESGRETAETRQARDHFRRGKEAYAQGRFEDAYREFELGYRLSDRPLFLLNMGHARRRAGALPEARLLYRRFLELQPDSPYRSEVEGILREMDAAAPSPAPTPAPPPAAVVPVTPPPVAVAPPVAPPPAPAPALVIPPREPAAEPRPASRSWLLWAGAGGAVAAAVVVGLVAAASGGDSYTKRGSIGTLGSP
jgi:tetratricopeptide (TPR) repeat protein